MFVIAFFFLAAVDVCALLNCWSVPTALIRQERAQGVPKITATCARKYFSTPLLACATNDIEKDAGDKMIARLEAYLDREDLRMEPGDPN